MTRTFALSFLAVLLLFSCSVDTHVGCSNSSSRTSIQNQTTIIHEGGSPEPVAPPTTTRTLVPEFGTFLNEQGLKGCVLLYEAASDSYFSNDFAWARRGFLPASTFKIPHSIIGMESGVLEDRSSLFAWDGAPRSRKELEKDMDLEEAYRLSCLPCYQELARKEGRPVIQEWVDKMNYGHMDIAEDNYDEFWVVGESRINAFEQIDFLQAFRNREFEMSNRTFREMRHIMVNEEGDGYTIHAKTGWSITGDTLHNGWFVGYVDRTEGEPVYFATNLEPTPAFDMDQFYRVRKEATVKALRIKGIL